ncbi:MAG: M55 family metallopeptidase [Clostridia bacterium]|nr:M55 family metallopeptidase [Clostridia bacterium]
MKLFISADIEGVAGLAMYDEANKAQAPYAAFAKEMTDEVLAACEAAHAAGADEIVVKDGHGDFSNIDPLRMPGYVTLIRGKGGHPYNMMTGIDESFDGVLYIGYHAPAGNPHFAMSHTSTGNSLFIRLNGAYMSEFMLNSYTAASLGVPVLFIAGDREICRQAKELVPGIETAVTKWGTGSATFCVAREEVLARIADGVKAALSMPFPAPLPLPEKFVYEPTYKDWKKAYQMSFFPGMRQVDAFTNRLESDSWMDIVTAHSFVVY